MRGPADRAKDILGRVYEYFLSQFASAEGKKGGQFYTPSRDMAGFCKATKLDDIRQHGHVLTPGRYVGAEAVEDDGEPFEEKMRRLTATVGEQTAEAAKLDAAIVANLKKLGYGD